MHQRDNQARAAATRRDRVRTLIESLSSLVKQLQDGSEIMRTVSVNITLPANAKVTFSVGAQNNGSLSWSDRLQDGTEGDRDLPSQMLEIRALAAVKQATRRVINEAENITGFLAAAQNTLQNELDSDNAISTTTSMMLQMLMDVRSKLLQTASDIEKSLVDTDMAIADNMKT